MNKKQLFLTILSAGIIGFILIFPPKALIRNKKIIMRVLPFQTKKITGHGIMIETSYRDQKLSYDIERTLEFITVVIFIGGVFIYLSRNRNKVRKDSPIQ